MDYPIVTDFRELCDAFEYYGYQTILDEGDMKQSINIIIIYKRMVFIYPILIDMLDSHKS